jgi:hypothetical protein
MTLADIYHMFYRANARLNRLIVSSCLHGFIIHSTNEKNLFLKHILPDIPASQIDSLSLWHNSSYEQLLTQSLVNLCMLHRLVLKRLKNVSFDDCRQLLKHLKCLRQLEMIDFNTAKVDWLDDDNWNDLINVDLPQLSHLEVRICIIYDRQIYDDDKDNIIYSYTSRYARPIDRLYTGSLLKKDPMLEICLCINRTIPLR